MRNQFLTAPAPHRKKTNSGPKTAGPILLGPKRSRNHVSGCMEISLCVRERCESEGIIPVEVLALNFRSQIGNTTADYEFNGK